MKCHILGALEVRDSGGHLMAVRGAKERRLLGILVAAHPAAVSVDRLLDDLWEGAPPPSAAKSLQAHLVRLRTSLEPDRPRGSPGRHVIRNPAGYVLALPRTDIDAPTFVDLSSRGRALLSAGDARGASAVLDDALALWRGVPYADWPDATFADAERRRLESLRADSVCARIEAHLALGRHREAVPELEQLVTEDPLREELWSMLAVALYRSGRQGDALTAVRRARHFLAEELGVSPGPLLSRTEGALLAQDASLDVPDPPTAATSGSDGTGAPRPGCPYKGLAAYGPEDAATFHGRSSLVQRLVAGLVDRRLLVVSGSSGAGKSSVVRAGLLPALGRGGLPRSQAWSQRVITPGPRAVDALAGLAGESPPDVPLVLVVDQLEQQWSPRTDPAERDAFLATLLGMLEEDILARLVLVVRGDHIGRLAEQPGMAEHLVGALELVPPLTQAELREVVLGPAATAGLRVDDDLLETVVSDVLGRQGALPLMSMALVGTWARRRDHTLTLAGYLESGGVAGAVARTAEDVYASLEPPAREVLRTTMLRLAEQDEHGSLKRRRLDVEELELAGPGGGVRRRVIDALVAHRLLTWDSAHLEVAHEALLGAWPRLARWLDDDAVGRAVRRHLAPAAREWQENGRPADELYRGARLEAATVWMAGPDADPTPVERDFVAAGAALAEAELTVARARADAESRGRVRTRRLAVGLSAVLVVALVAAGLAVRYQRTAEERATEADTARTVADGNRLAALSTSARSLDLSLLLAAQAMRTARTPETEDGLLGALLGHRRATAIHSLDDGVEDTTIAADGRTMFVVLGGATPRVVSWRIGSPRPAETVHEGHVWGLAASPTGDVVAVTTDLPGGGAGVRAFSRAGEPLGAVRGPWGAGGFPIDVAYTAHGRLLALVSRRAADRSVATYVTEIDLQRGTHRPMRGVASFAPGEFPWGRFTEDGSAVNVGTGVEVTYVDLARGRTTALDLSGQGRTPYDFVIGPTGMLRTWSDGAFTRYDVSGQPAQVLEAHSSPVLDVAVTPDGRAAVTVGVDGEAVLWEIAPGSGNWSKRESLVGHEGSVHAVEMSPDGSTALTIAQDGMVISWDLTGSAGFGATYGLAGDRWISNRIQVVEPGLVVVAPVRSLPTAGEPGSDKVAAVFLDPRTGREIASAAVGRTDPGFLFGSSVSVSPDRTRVAVTHAFGIAIVDTRTHEVVGRVTLPGPDSRSRGPVGLVWCSAWTPDGSRLLLGVSGRDGDPQESLAVIDADSLDVVGEVDVPDEAQVLDWSPDGATLAVGAGYEPAVTFLDRDLEIVRTVEVGDPTFDVAWSPDGTRLASGGEDGEVSVVDVVSGDLVHPPTKVFGAHVVDVEWLSGSRVVVSGTEGSAAIYDVERDVIRAGALPASDVESEVYAFLLPEPADDVIVLDGLHPGNRYPLDPAVWLAEACRIAGRDLTEEEWNRHVPNDPYRPTCSDLGIRAVSGARS